MSDWDQKAIVFTMLFYVFACIGGLIYGLFFYGGEHV